MALSVMSNNSTDRVLIVDETACCVGTLTGSVSTIDLPKVDNSFRGGSRGKGGKIKYRRK